VGKRSTTVKGKLRRQGMCMELRVTTVITTHAKKGGGQADEMPLKK
jgi:hypothetical protein